MLEYIQMNAIKQIASTAEDEVDTRFKNKIISRLDVKVTIGTYKIHIGQPNDHIKLNFILFFRKKRSRRSHLALVLIFHLLFRNSIYSKNRLIPL